MERGYTKMKTLADIREGQKVKISCLHCGHGMRHRLCSLGILEGQSIEIIKNENRGPIIIKVFDSKIAIGRGQAGRITVECQ